MDPIKVDGEIMGGTPCFAGTRVPIRTLFDYLDHGYPLAEFLHHFPTVGRDQAAAVIKMAADKLLASLPKVRPAALTAENLK